MMLNALAGERTNAVEVPVLPTELKAVTRFA
jgi:hypothetical protein